MNAGQMFVQMSVGAQLPAAVQAPAPAASSPTGGQQASGFAGVLREVSPRESVRPADSTGTEKAAHAKHVHGDNSGLALGQPDSRPDTPTKTPAGKEAGARVVPSVEKAAEEVQDTEGIRVCPEVPVPQNVVLCAAEAQVGAAQLINGRMPEAELNNDGQDSQSPTAGLAGIKPLFFAAAPQAPAVLPEAVMLNGIENLQVPVVAAPEKTVEGTDAADRQHAAASPESAVQEPGMAACDAAHETPVVPAVEHGVVPTALAWQDVSHIAIANPEQMVLSPDNAATNLHVAAAAQAKSNDNARTGSNGTAYPATTKAEQAGPVETSARLQPVNGSPGLRNDAGIQAVQSVITETVQDHPATSAPAPEISAAASTSVPEEKSVSALSVRPNLDAYFQTSVRPASVTATDSTLSVAQEEAPPSIADVPSDAHPAIDAAQRPARGEVRPSAELMAAQDQPVSRQGSAEGTAKTEAGAAHAVTGVVKEVATTTPGEDFGRNGTSSGDQWMNNNTHLAMSHQVAPENALPATGTSAIAGSDPLRTVQAEQIVSQVKDHLAGRDIKSGVEQVVIRLSPENLGELKMSLRMENQCLKVEIVAETSMVRDALMKHSDTLKESLARQNISMESFDVSTGSNRFGSASQGQGDWRELARQRQSNVWTSAGGYRLDTVAEAPLRPLYQASATHSMVDMHF